MSIRNIVKAWDSSSDIVEIKEPVSIRNFKVLGKNRSVIVEIKEPVSIRNFFERV